jgi:hypothetical protein
MIAFCLAFPTLFVVSLLLRDITLVLGLRVITRKSIQVSKRRHFYCTLLSIRE